VIVEEQMLGRDLAGVFTDSKTVENRALNRAGAQPFRAVLARFLYRLRPRSADPDAIELYNHGIVVRENFLPSDAFVAVQDEAENYMAVRNPTVLDRWGTTELRHYHLLEPEVDQQSFPHLVQWKRHHDVLALASAAERRACTEHSANALLEHLAFGDNSDLDTQTELHIDTFHNTHRIWLYLDDVDAENGPFVYVPGSHRLDHMRLREEYVESIRENGKSRRIHDEELRRRGLKERVVVTCPRNTLVVANTCGYHCRSAGKLGATRRALHMTFRFNPFELEPFVSGIKRSAAEMKHRVGRN
jgi:hypothetical protein